MASRETSPHAPAPRRDLRRRAAPRRRRRQEHGQPRREARRASRPWSRSPTCPRARPCGCAPTSTSPTATASSATTRASTGLHADARPRAQARLAHDPARPPRPRPEPHARVRLPEAQEHGAAAAVRSSATGSTSTARRLNGIAVKAIESLKPGQFCVFENVRRYGVRDAACGRRRPRSIDGIADDFERIARAFRQGATVYVNDAIAASNKDFSSAALPLAMGSVALGRVHPPRAGRAPRARARGGPRLVLGPEARQAEGPPRHREARPRREMLIAGGSLAMALRKAEGERRGVEVSIGAAGDEEFKDERAYVPPVRRRARAPHARGREAKGVKVVLPVDFVLDDGTVATDIPARAWQLRHRARDAQALRGAGARVGQDDAPPRRLPQRRARASSRTGPSPAAPRRMIGTLEEAPGRRRSPSTSAAARAAPPSSATASSPTSPTPSRPAARSSSASPTSRSPSSRPWPLSPGRRRSHSRQPAGDVRPVGSPQFCAWHGIDHDGRAGTVAGRQFSGAVAHLVERLVRNQKVRGSSPLSSTPRRPGGRLCDSRLASSLLSSWSLRDDLRGQPTGSDPRVAVIRGSPDPQTRQVHGLVAARRFGGSAHGQRPSRSGHPWFAGSADAPSPRAGRCATIRGLAHGQRPTRAGHQRFAESGAAGVQSTGPDAVIAK